MTTSIANFSALAELAAATPPVTLSIAGAQEPEALISAAEARQAGLIERAILVGDAAAINGQLEQLDIDPAGFSIRHATDAPATAALAVQAVRQGEADILLKGALDSASYFRAILDREQGLRASGLLSNVTVFQLPSYHKLLTVTDNAIMLQPDREQKQAIIENTRPLFRALHITPAKVGVIAAVEKENPNMPATTDAAWLRTINAEGQLEGFIVDGPFGYDACICRESAAKKGLGDSPVAGDPDLLLMPNLEAANILGKAYKYHANADSGGLVLGARAPVVLNSRSDSSRRRFNSLLLAKAVAHGSHNPL